MTPTTLLTTDHATFYRAINGKETRYYPQTRTSGENRAAAQEFDASGNPDPVMGFGAYDTNISTQYAVALYATKAEAEAHQTTAAPAPENEIFSIDEPNEEETPVLPEVDAPENPSKGLKNPFKGKKKQSKLKGK